MNVRQFSGYFPKHLCMCVYLCVSVCISFTLDFIHFVYFWWVLLRLFVQLFCRYFIDLFYIYLCRGFSNFDSNFIHWGRHCGSFEFVSPSLWSAPLIFYAHCKTPQRTHTQTPTLTTFSKFSEFFQFSQFSEFFRLQLQSPSSPLLRHLSFLGKIAKNSSKIM